MPLSLAIKIEARLIMPFQGKRKRPSINLKCSGAFSVDNIQRTCQWFGNVPMPIAVVTATMFLNAVVFCRVKRDTSFAIV